MQFALVFEIQVQYNKKKTFQGELHRLQSELRYVCNRLDDNTGVRLDRLVRRIHDLAGTEGRGEEINIYERYYSRTSEFHF
jgi:hypothetical protein